MFDHLTPADFVRDTSAREVQETPEAISNLGLNRGRIGYDLFVDLWLTKCRQRSAEQDDFAPFAVLSNPHAEWYFEGEDDELPADFARRLQREATQLGATWLFVAMVAPGRAVYKDDEKPAPIGDDVASIEAALINGELDLCICWSSASNEDQRTRAGIMYLDDDGQIASEIEAPLNPDTDPFREVLP